MTNKGYLDIDRVEFQRMEQMDYFSLVDYLREKYGAVTGAYFVNENCATPNRKITRTNEALQVHHVGEYTIPELSNKNIAKRNSWDEQQPDRLVYCNLLEHTLLHVLIVEKQQNLGGYFMMVAPLVKDIINDYEFKREYQQKMSLQLREHKDLLLKLFNRAGFLFFLKS
ncbi:hypothetical protein OURE66S_01861 [Oligella ureolytica]